MVELNNIQKKVLNLLAQSPISEKFYWTGGTLLASQYLHHRLSEDLDFFASEKFSYRDIIGFVNDLQKKVKLEKIEEKRVHDRWEFLIKNKERVRVEFVFYNFPELKPKRRWQGVLVDSFDDLLANKTMTLFDRAYPKDLFYIYCLITQKKIRVEALLKRAEKKFGVKISESSLWAAAEKSLRELSTIKPFLLAGTETEKREILERVKDYVISRSTSYLRRFLK